MELFIYPFLPARWTGAGAAAAAKAMHESKILFSLNEIEVDRFHLILLNVKRVSSGMPAMSHPDRVRCTHTHTHRHALTEPHQR